MPETHCGFGIVRVVAIIVVERDGELHLDGPVEERQHHTEVRQRRHGLRVEGGHRAGPERDVPLPTLRRAKIQGVPDEVELDLDAAGVGVHERRREAARRDVQGNLPPVIHHRLECQAHLADDLEPELEGFSGLLPGRQSELRPLTVFGCCALWSRPNVRELLSSLGGSPEEPHCALLVLRSAAAATARSSAMESRMTSARSRSSSPLDHRSHGDTRSTVMPASAARLAWGSPTPRWRRAVATAAA